MERQRSKIQDLSLLNVEGADGLSADERLVQLLVDRRARILAYVGPRREGGEAEGWGDLEDERVRRMMEWMERRDEELRVEAESRRAAFAETMIFLKQYADDARFGFQFRDGLTAIVSGRATALQIGSFFGAIAAMRGQDLRRPRGRTDREK
jgi:hypothetical protein